MTGELSPASVYVSLLPVVEACVVVAVPGRVGEVRVAADEPEAVDLDPSSILASRRRRIFSPPPRTKRARAAKSMAALSAPREASAEASRAVCSEESGFDY